MSTTYHVVCRALSSNTVVASKLSKKSFSLYVCGLKPLINQRTLFANVITIIILMSICTISFAQQLVYDGTGNAGTASLKDKNTISSGLPLWMNLGAGDKGVIYLDNNGAGDFKSTEADLLINYNTGDAPKFVIGGYADNSTEVMQNAVTLTQGAIDGSVYGGISQYTGITNSIDNSLLTGNNVSANTSLILPDYSTISSIENTVNIDGKNNVVSVQDNVYGGYSTFFAQTGDAKSGVATSTTIADAQASSRISSFGLTVKADKNNVFLKNSIVTGSIYGGHASVIAQAGNSTANSATSTNTISGTHSNASGSADTFFVSLDLHTSENKVTIGDNVSISGDVYGGYTSINAVAGNAVAGMAAGGVGAVAYADATSVVDSSVIYSINNQIAINQSASITGNIYGGYAEVLAGAGSAKSGTALSSPQPATAIVDMIWTQVVASGNKVSFNGNLQGGDIYGGYIGLEPSAGLAIGNGSTEDDSIALESSVGEATHNIINIGADARIMSTNTAIYGGFLNHATNSMPETYDIFSGNTLNYSAKLPTNIKLLANFENINFIINPAYANKNTALITADEIVLGANEANMDVSNLNEQVTKIKVVGIHSGNVLNAGDEFILMQTNNMLGDGTGLATMGVAQQGISFIYDIQTNVDKNNQKVTAEILGRSVGVAAQVNPQLKALSEGRLAGLMLVTRGADMIADKVFNVIDAQNSEYGLTPFVLMSGGYNRYNSGSHIDSNDFLLTAGVSLKHNNLTIGSFVENGWGSYDTYNSFYNAFKVHGNGDSRYYGLGLLSRYKFSDGFYADASLRFGRNRNKFSTRDIVNITSGEHVKYTLKGDYISAHFGVGYLVDVSDKNQLDLSVKYLYSTLSSKNIIVAGDPIHFDRVNSRRAKINSKFIHNLSESITLNIGLGYEYEFDGKAKANTFTIYEIKAPSVKGGTGIVSLGATVKPLSNQNLTLNFSTDGYVGKREGIGATAQVSYAF